MRFDFVKGYGMWQKAKEEQITEAEEEMKLRFPKELLTFYREIGYGLLRGEKRSDSNSDRVMGPLSICDFRLRRDYYEYYEVIEEYDDYENGRIIFFESDSSWYFSIEITDNYSAKIYYKNVQIADSLEEFLREMIKDDMYFMPIVDEYFGNLPDDEV